MKEAYSFAMKSIITFLFIAGIYIGCTSKSDFKVGKNQSERIGYNSVVNTGSAYWCCSDQSDYRTGFKAKAKNGRIVTGCFCSKLGEGVTIRFKNN
jgi:hypothetical protein